MMELRLKAQSEYHGECELRWFSSHPRHYQVYISDNFIGLVDYTDRGQYDVVIYILQDLNNPVQTGIFKTKEEACCWIVDQTFICCL